MLKFIKRMLLVAALLVPWVTQAQVTLPYSTGFETNDDMAWTFVNDATNKWYIGSATHNSGSAGLYISNDNGSTSSYTNTATQFSYAYREFTITDAAQIAVSFDWVCNGESNYDYLRAWIAPSTASFSAGLNPEGSTSAYNYTTATPSGWTDLGGKMNLQTTWQTTVGTASLSAGTYCLVFMWANDGSGGSVPPAAIDNVFITELSCAQPTGLAAVVGIDQMDFTWTAGGDETEWKVVLSDTLVDYVTTESYSYTNLEPNTQYTFKVYAICGAGDTSLATVGSYRTLCTALTTLPYTMGFETSDGVTSTGSTTSTTFVNCWHRLNNGTQYFGYPYVSSSSSYNHNTGGSRGLYWYNATTTGTYGDYQVVVLPGVDTTVYPTNTLMLRFWAKASSTSYNPDFIPGVMTDPTDITTFQQVGPVIHVRGTEWVQYDAYFNDYVGDGSFIALRANRPSSYWYAYVDEFTLMQIPACLEIRDLAAAPTVGAAVLSWTASASDPECHAMVEYKVDTATEWTYAGEAEGLTYTLTGLEAGTAYNVRVAALCNFNADTSIWQYVNFSTGLFQCLALDEATADTLYFSNSTSGTSGCLAYSSYGNTAYQTIYTAAELTAAGLQPGPITGIDLGFTASSSYSKEFTIFMGNTTTTSISNATLEDPNAQTQVYGPAAHPSGTSGWQHYDFDVPFVWDGTSSIIMTTFMNQPQGQSQSSSSGLTGYYVSASNKARYRYKDSNPFTLADYNSGNSGSTYSYRASIHFYSGECETMATCASPAATIGAVDTSSVVVSWAPGANETSWEIWYRQGNSGGFIVADNGVTDLEYTFTNLNPGSEYNFRVVNICDPDTFYSATLSVFTDCAPSSGEFENFDSYTTGSSGTINPCWYKNVYGTSTAYPYVNTINGAKALYFYGYTSGSSKYYSWVATPEMRDSVNTYEIEFDMWKTSTTAYYTSRVLIGAMTNPNDITTFDTIADITDNMYGMWEAEHVSLENYHGDGKYIALLCPDPGAFNPNYTYAYNYFYIDNLYIGRRSSCPTPTRFHARDITANSAELAWDSVDNYMYGVVKYNNINDIASATAINVTDATTQLTGLTPNTTYYCWLTEFCADDSSRTVNCSFTTTAACSPAVNLIVADISSTTASLTWASDPVTEASSYVFEWKEGNASTWNTENTSNTFIHLSGLTAGTTYEARVMAVCSEGNAAYTNITFNTSTPGTIGFNESGDAIPCNPYYEYSISEQIWLASELAEYGDTIWGIYFYSLSSTTGRDISMWVTDTTLSNISTSAYVPSTAMTQVLDTTMNFTTGWNYFPFDEPFVRDVNKNLVVLTYDHTGDYESSFDWAVSTSAVNSLYDYQDGTPYSTTDLSALTQTAERAMMSLNAAMQPVTCVAPHVVVSNATDNSISLSWLRGLNETSWSVDYHALGETTWTVIAATTTDTFATVNNLNPSTSYVFRVGSICGTDVVYASVRGTTACGAFSVPYLEDFNVYSSDEANFAPCWYKGIINGTTVPLIKNITGVGPSVEMHTSEYMILPQFDVPVNQLQLRLQFVVAQPTFYAYVGVCSHPTDFYSMTIIDTLTVGADEAGIPVWRTVTFDSYTRGDGYIIIYSPVNYTYYDNINVEMIPQCGVVDSMFVTSATTTGATLTWNNASNGSSYIVRYYSLTGTSNTVDTVVTTSNSIALTGLQPSTTYGVDIYTICSVLQDTSNVATFKFQTECDTVSLPYFEDFENCNAPALTATGVLPNCWSYVMTSSGTYAGASYIPMMYSGNASSGHLSLRLYGRTVLTLPEMPVDVNELMISFHEYNSSTSYYRLVLGVCDSNWGNFEQSFVPIDTIPADQASSWVTSFKLANYTGTGRYIAFTNYYYNSTNDYSYHYIDDITVDYLPSCLPVDNLHSNGNTSSTISIDWNDLAASTEWEVSYSTTPLTDPSLGTTAIVNAHPYNVTGLTAGTNYYFYVRNICGVGDTSIWAGFGPSAPGQWIMRPGIDTLYMCGGVIYDDGGPNGQYSDNQNNTIILMPSVPSSLVSVSGWTADESSFDYLNIYDGIGTTGTLLYSSNVSGSYAGTFTDLTSTTGPLTLLFHSDGSVHSYAGFEVNVSCISVSCMVTGLGLNPNEPQNSTELSLVWDDINAMKYQVAYGTPGFDIDAATTTIYETFDTNYVITGLTGLMNYEVQVRGICSGADTGSWTHNIFQTAMCDNVVIAQNFYDSISASTSTYSPMGTSFYNYGYNQIIIDSSYLAGVEAELSAMAFKPASTSQGNYYNHITVYMANIPDSLSLASSFIHPADVGGFDTVITDRDMCYTTTDWQMQGFDHPFTWDGHSNILISIQRNHGSYASGASFNAHNHPAGKARYIYQDSGPYDPSTVSEGTAITTVGDIRLFSCGASCAKPRLLPVSDLSYNTATINWNSTETDFEVAVKAATDATWPAEVAVSNATSYVADNLQSSTTYQYRVRTICDATENVVSDWSEGTFVTDSLPCFAPSDLQTTEVDVTSATLAWTAGGAETQWSIHVWNSGFNEEYTATSNPFTVTGLT
ncbi:MAG: fibronectin type III domain-containing protein, partial [Bacteroidales bacterium]|nr:fibronectin type III domain-containing protein [Bacteroidales bacterium]